MTVIFGTWCGDSRREVPRLWRALDAAGPDLPFTLKYVGVDRQKTAPGFDKEGLDLRYVPTVIVVRDGREVGRIVERAERDRARAARAARRQQVGARHRAHRPRPVVLAGPTARRPGAFYVLKDMHRGDSALRRAGDLAIALCSKGHVH
ncbi:TlpA family protein disulfide reductase [Nannocystis pusilla]|uniref:TlpA family protein disulfide reductase n=1 Tax=Nannocystis pusilla TaxID=889268 RepID=UPI003B7D77C5